MTIDERFTDDNQYNKKRFYSKEELEKEKIENIKKAFNLTHGKGKRKRKKKKR